MSLKGISPLIAAVLLIAVTMTIAGVLAYWASTFVRGQTDTFSNRSFEIDCAGGNLLMEACSYDSTNERVTFILNNIGSNNLNNVSVFAIYPDNTLNQTQTGESILSGSLKSFSVDSVVDGFSTIRIRTHCPGISVEATCR